MSSVDYQKFCLPIRLRFVVTSLILCCSFFLTIRPSFAQNGFTINESLMINNVSNITLGGSAHLTAGSRDNDGAGWLRLTNANNNEAGFALINEAFRPDQGLVLDFEFAIWGGSGADGFCIFLFDANYSLNNPPGHPFHFSLGNLGGALGYANGGTNPGLSGGYLGIGLDAFGNYAVANESKAGGVSNSLSPNRIGIRGAANSNYGLPYRWLGGSEPLQQVFGGGFTLDYKGAGAIRPTKEQHYRRIQVRLMPIENNGQTNYEVSVHLKVNENSQFVPVVPPFIILDPPPALLKVGFSGVTGGQHNIHEVRNLVVTTLGGIRVHKTVDKLRARLGEQLVYDIRLINESSYNGQNLQFRDLIPPDFKVSNITFDNGGDAVNEILSGWQPGQLDLNEVLLNLKSAPYGEVKFRVVGTIEDYPDNYAIINTARFDLTDRSNILDEDLSNNVSTVRTDIFPADIQANRDAYDFDKFSTGNILSNDRYNDLAIEPRRISIRVVTPANPIHPSAPVPYISEENGDIIVSAGTPRGNYLIIYQIIDKKLPSNFSEAIVELFIVPDVINTQPDAYTINWADGGKTESVLANDKVNNQDFLFSWSTFEWLTPAPAGITLSNDGTISVATMTPKGQYELRYRIVDQVYSNNFQENVAILTVMPNILKAVNDYKVVRYNRKQMMVSNMLENDLFNGKPIDASQVNIAITSLANSGIFINDEGNLILDETLQYGMYDFTYSICDRLDGADCSTGAIRLKVLPYVDHIPNVITPNGDGLNDVFFISVGVDVQKMELKVVNRNGNVLYNNPDYRNDWSPTDADIKEGTYLYELVITFAEGLTEVYRGDLLIARDRIQ